MERQVTKFTVIIHLNHRDIYNLRWNKIQEMDGFKFILASQPSVQPCYLLDPEMAAAAPGNFSSYNCTE